MPVDTDMEDNKKEEKITPKPKQPQAPTDDATSTVKANSRRQADKNNGKAPAEEGYEGLSLKEVIQEQAIEDEAPLSSNLSLRKILGGDILNTAIIRRQIWLFVLITFFFIIYISNRYSCQQDIIEIDRLQKELLDAKYKALSSNSQLTEKSRESNVLEMLKSNNDSTIKIASQPPYIINVPEEKQP